MSDALWKTRDGTEIAVEDMETSHIRNALTLLRRNGFISPRLREFYFNCSEPSGDMAQLAFEQEVTEVIRAPCSQFVDMFEDELQRRANRED